MFPVIRRIGSLFFIVILSLTVLNIRSQDAPKVMPFLAEVKLRLGDRFQLVCTVQEGSPPILFRWYKDSVPLSNTTEVSMHQLDNYSSSLIINGVREIHLGNYSCVVSNAVGSESASSELQILVPPFWIRQPVDLSLLIGSDAVFECSIGGSPTPLLKWMRTIGNLHLPIVANESERLKVDGGTLRILQIEKADEGFYTCEGDNGVDEGIRKSVKLEVNVPPSMNTSYEIVHIYMGDQFFMKCNVSGDHPLIVTWKKDNQLLRNGRVQKIEETNSVGTHSKIWIPKATRASSGVYECLVENMFGEVAKKTMLLVDEPPDAPPRVRIPQAWTREFHVVWDPPFNGNRPILEYVITYWPNTGYLDPIRSTKEVSGPQHSALIQELVPSIEYKVQIQAKNTIGLGKPSKPVTVQLNLEEPHVAPSDVRAVAVDSTAAKVFWQGIPLMESTLILGYYVGYRKAMPPGPYTYNTVPIANESMTAYSTVISGLHPSTTYNVIVCGFNAVGMGPASETVYLQTWEASLPSPPMVKLGTISSTTVSILISPHTMEKSQITAFVLHIRRDFGKWHDIPLFPQNESSYLIGGISPGTSYQLNVTSRNQFGESRSSESIRFHTPYAEWSIMDIGDGDFSNFYLSVDLLLSIIIPLTIIIIIPIIACCIVKRMKMKTPDDSNEFRIPCSMYAPCEGVEVRGFTFTPGDSDSPPEVRRPLPRPTLRLHSPSDTLSTYHSEVVYEEPTPNEPAKPELKTFLAKD